MLQIWLIGKLLRTRHRLCRVRVSNLLPPERTFFGPCRVLPNHSRPREKLRTLNEIHFCNRLHPNCSPKVALRKKKTKMGDEKHFYFRLITAPCAHFSLLLSTFSPPSHFLTPLLLTHSRISDIAIFCGVDPATRFCCLFAQLKLPNLTFSFNSPRTVLTLLNFNLPPPNSGTNYKLHNFSTRSLTF